MNQHVLDFQEIENTMPMAVGGKGLNLAELSRLDGIQVPGGFCVTTEAYDRTIADNEELNTLLEQLTALTAGDKKMVAEISAKIRRIIEGAKIPGEIEEQIIHCLSKLGEEKAYAIRSSATAEDLPLTSFAGQHDTYLNIKGKNAVLQHIVKCWASLFTDRAMTYRMQNGFDHRQVRLAVVIQQMILPQASGILFTADPVTGNRNVLSINASYGLGEAAVSGTVNSDLYKVRDGRIIDKKIAAKKVEVSPLEEGGTREREVEPERQNSQTLTDGQILRLAQLGKDIEAHFACPQDIEWCLIEDRFYIVQSRPITTLYPIPAVNDGKSHVFLSFGHSQIMTEAMKPLGISFMQLVGRVNGISGVEAGGRLFFDITGDLASPIRRKFLLSSKNNANFDELMRSALSRLIMRKDYMKTLSRKRTSAAPPIGKILIGLISAATTMVKTMRKNDASLIGFIYDHNESLIRNIELKVRGLSHDDLFEFILRDQKELFANVFYPPCIGACMAWAKADAWLRKNIEKWLGEKNAVDTLVKSVSNNITSEMGLALLDVSDVARQYPAVMDYFHYAADKTFFEDLAKVEGGDAVGDSIRVYLEKYGMRCPGEIDITKPRWSEKPTQLIPPILSNIKNFEPNAHAVKFEQGRLEAEQKEQDVLARLMPLPRGKQKARKTKKMISILRNFACLREFPKYLMIWRYQIYKDALMREATMLVEKGVIKEKEDIYYLKFEEFREVVKTNRLDYSIITRRKEEYTIFEKLTPPRVMTSDGEVIPGEYATDGIPKGALVGLPVSSGTVEGRARVLSRMDEADMEDDDILVTAFTDPGWTPLFVSVKGLVTEVGGLMTHGSVIAREYGLPAVVGVENATQLIKNGQRIRVNGTQGYVEIL